MANYQKHPGGFRRRSSYPQQRQADTRHLPAPTPAPENKKNGVVKGRADLWQTLQVAIDGATGATKTTRILEMDIGVLVNTCTRSPAGMCEALQFVAGATAKHFEGRAS